MKIMAIDAEYTQPNTKLIQVAAAIFDSKNGQLLDTYEAYVNPGESISKYIEDLTGISDLDVSNAKPFLEIYIELKDLHSKHKCFKNPLVWGSGASNDSQKMYLEAFPTKELREQNPNFMGHRVLDVKSIYQSIQLFHNKSFSGTLRQTCDKIGIGFQGEEHRALNDAINTFRVWYFLMKDFPRGFK